MTEDKNTDLEKDENAHFDMYHFYKRKDVWLVALVLLGLVIFVLYLMTGGTHPTV